MAASLNRVILCGNLTDDPERSYLPSGLAVTQMSLAVNERVKNPQGEWKDRVCFIDVSVFGAQAEACGEYLSKGSPVLLEGKLRFDTWEGKDGTRRSKHSIAAERVQFLSSRRDEKGEAPAPKSAVSETPPPRKPATPLGEPEADEDLPPF